MLEGKHMQAVSTQSGHTWSETSSSGEGDDKVLAYEAQWKPSSC